MVVSRDHLLLQVVVAKETVGVAMHISNIFIAQQQQKQEEQPEKKDEEQTEEQKQNDEEKKQQKDKPLDEQFCKEVTGNLSSALRSLENTHHLLSSLSGSFEDKLTTVIKGEEEDFSGPEDDQGDIVGFEELVREAEDCLSHFVDRVKLEYEEEQDDTGDKIEEVNGVAVIKGEYNPGEVAGDELSGDVKREARETLWDQDFEWEEEEYEEIKEGKKGRGRPRKDKRIDCDICGKSVGRESYEKHLNMHAGLKPYKCKVCSNRFTSKSALKYHQYQHDGKKPHSCEICGASFILRFRLTNHMLTHTENEKKLYSCEVCNKAYSFKASLADHMKVHREESPFKCDVCGLAFKQRNALKRHMMRHEKTYTCKTCGEQCKGKEAYKAHRAEMHSYAAKKLEAAAQNLAGGEKISANCETCGKSFSSKSGLYLHQMRHEGKTPFTCDKCGKSFVASSLLKAHMETHADKTLTACKICDKLVTNLDKHMLIHLKQFSCDLCNKTFSTKYSLNNHMMMHEGKRAFSCETCGKSFTQLRVLQEHENIHKGIKPFTCNICFKGFTQRSTLGRHKLSHKSAMDSGLELKPPVIDQ
eukprot:TRINITY_DN12344_c0_g1_i12.p1 TRINITY_DN12344_c0_g1~~TRINITY_DN12344_c0_g1_i12.p1  ORF type:complete len:586 (-),score=125.28 TRINITY_DN12344_c0_g1_i12:252-2009(-)